MAPPLSDSCLWQYLVEDDVTATQPPLSDSVLWQYIVEPTEETVATPKMPVRARKQKPIESTTFNRLFVRGFPLNYTGSQRKQVIRDMLSGTIYAVGGYHDIVRSLKVDTRRKCRGTASIHFCKELKSVHFKRLSEIFHRNGSRREEGSRLLYKLSIEADLNSKLDNLNKEQNGDLSKVAVNKKKRA